MHLAQVNVAHLVAPTDSPLIADFMDALEPVNVLAESSPGFVWRLVGGEDPRDTVTHDYGDLLLVNCSVWESREALWNYVYRSGHLDLLRRRREWFHRATEPSSVMWWIPEGRFPTVAEAMARLHRLRAEGPGPEAFTFTDFHEPQPAPEQTTVTGRLRM